MPLHCKTHTHTHTHTHSRLLVFRRSIKYYSENHAKFTNTFCCHRAEYLTSKLLVLLKYQPSFKGLRKCPLTTFIILSLRRQNSLYHCTNNCEIYANNILSLTPPGSSLNVIKSISLFKTTFLG